ncbi:transcription factor S [Candidatus Woesearchaeota archaeon]|jgi:transcription factor S|nr:transcription factor S [Candidatus Woesearchaeota archaeon]
MFCPKCKSILRPKEKAGKRILWCSCGHNSEPGEESPELREKIAKTAKIEVMENVETNPRVEADCAKCDNKEAFYWTRQTRGADEPETRFFKCTKCNHTWREYS